MGISSDLEARGQETSTTAQLTSLFSSYLRMPVKQPALIPEMLQDAYDREVVEKLEELKRQLQEVAN